MSEDVQKNPYSIRCLKAIESLAGGRSVLAKFLDVTPFALDQWTKRRKIPSSAILGLIKAGKEKFTAEELLGAHDAN